jgi:proline iminopeptidase
MKTSKSIMLSVLMLLGVVFFVMDRAFSQQESGYLEVDEDIRLHYRITGTGEDTLLVADVGWFYPYIEAYGRDITYIVYDVRDRGYSDQVDDPALISLEYEISDLEKVRQYFHLKKMNIMGWSYLGSMVALYASQYPDHVNAIVQVGPVPCRREGYWLALFQDRMQRRDTTLDAKLEKMKASGIDRQNPKSYCREFWKATIVSIIADETKADGLAQKVPYECENEWPQNVSMQILFEKLGDWDWRKQIKNVKARSLIVQGMKDNIPNESFIEWEQEMPDAQIARFYHSGHMPMAEEPDLFFRTLREFISGYTPAMKGI